MFERKQLTALSALLAAALALGCDSGETFVKIDDEPEAAAPATADPFDIELSASVQETAEPEPKQSSQAPQPPQTPPKFDAKGVSVDLTETVGFDGVQDAAELERWQKVKVVRGAGALSQGAVETFAKLPALTEFLWSDAVVDGDSQAALVKLAAAPSLKKLRLTGLKLADSGKFPVEALKGIAAFPALADLDVSGSPLAAEDLAQVDLKAGFPKLTKINLYQTKIGDAGVDALMPLADRLTSLNLDDAGISPVSAPKIAQFSNLTFLHVGRSTLDDESVAQFAKLTKLEKIHITRSAATEEGADALRKALPNCEVVSQPEK